MSGIRGINLGDLVDADAPRVQQDPGLYAVDGGGVVLVGDDRCRVVFVVVASEPRAVQWGPGDYRVSPGRWQGGRAVYLPANPGERIVAFVAAAPVDADRAMAWVHQQMVDGLPVATTSERVVVATIEVPR